MTLWQCSFLGEKEPGLGNSTKERTLSAEPFGPCCNPYPLTVGQSNTFVLLFLMLHKDSHLFPEIVNSEVRGYCHPGYIVSATKLKELLYALSSGSASISCTEFFDISRYNLRNNLPRS